MLRCGQEECSFDKLLEERDQLEHLYRYDPRGPPFRARFMTGGGYRLLASANFGELVLGCIFKIRSAIVPNFLPLSNTERGE